MPPIFVTGTSRNSTRAIEDRAFDTGGGVAIIAEADIRHGHVLGQRRAIDDGRREAARTALIEVPAIDRQIAHRRLADADADARERLGIPDQRDRPASAIETDAARDVDRLAGGAVSAKRPDIVALRELATPLAASHFASIQRF
ncbi:MAG: hypothetical protein IT338_08775 [Thermomicrobiales bacterium]|nr:hypothetical protein [Thermomicrobiales bacterium]